MAWAVIRLPEVDKLIEQLKEKRWVDFYLKNDYFTGSSDSISIISKLKQNGKIDIQLVEKESKEKSFTEDKFFD